MTPKPDQGGEKLAKAEQCCEQHAQDWFVSIEGMKETPLMDQDRARRFATVINAAASAWKSRAVKEALEKADSEIYEAMTKNAVEEPVAEWNQWLRGMQYARGILRQLAQEVGGE